MTDKTSAPAPTAKVETVSLSNPIERADGASVTTLTLRKPNAGNLRGLSLQALMQSDVGALITVVPRIADPFVTEQEVASLEADDLAQIGGAILGFFMTPAQKAMIAEMTG
jgi:hypothetical protein